MKTKSFVLSTIKTLLILAFSLLITSCTNEQPKDEDSECYRLLSGKHELRKLNVKNTTTTTESGCYFLIVGSYSSQTTEKAKARFYFLSINNEYIFKEMDLEKVIIKTDSSVQTPYVKFYFNIADYYSEYEIYEQCITRAVIYCKEEDFAPEINIDELQ